MIEFNASKKAAHPPRGTARRRALMIGLAVNFAMPMGIIARMATAAPAQSRGQDADNSQSLSKGAAQLKNGEYEEALESLQQVDADSLSAAERKSYDQLLNNAQVATEQRKLARQEFDAGEQALSDRNLAQAVTHYHRAAENMFADTGTRDKAREQFELAQAEAKSAGVDAKSLYQKGRKEYRSNDLEAARRDLGTARDLGYKPGLFEESPDSMLSKIDAKLKARTQHETVRQQVPVEPSKPQAEVQEKAKDNAPAISPQSNAAPRPMTGDVAKDLTQNAADSKNQATPASDTITIMPAPLAAQPTAELTADTQAPTTAPSEPAAAAPAAEPSATPAPAMPAAPAPAPAAEATGTPPAAPAPATPASAADGAISTASSYQKIRQQQAAYEAQQLVQKARQEDSSNQKSQAYQDYNRAAELDSNNQQAIAGRDELASQLGLGNRAVGLRNVETDINERISAIKYAFNSAIAAANQAISQSDFATAQRSIDRARIARNTDPTIFTQQQVNDFDTTIANTDAALERAKQTKAKADADRALASSIEAQGQRVQQAREDRQRTVAGLIQDARQYIEQGKYREALAVIDHIQALDPTNEYASSVRLLIEDKAANQAQRQYREEFDRQFTQQLNSVGEQKIPYEDILRYPANWPEISEMRDAEVKEERGEESEDAALQAQLDRRLPELRFNANSFSDVIDFLREVTGANIYVDWPALERASISRDAPVTTRLREVKFSKALELIFKSVEGEEDDRKLGYTVDEGVITISTRKELNKNTVTQRYDINDLLFVAPDYTNVPELNLQNLSQGSSGGGGGGGGSQSIFSGGEQGQNGQQQQGQREQRITEITKYISDNVDSTSWKENGGDVGTISSSPLRAVLLITQTPENHRKIVKVLDSLRASQALQVSIETRFLTVQRNYLEDIGVDADFTFNQNSSWSTRFSPIPVIQNQVTDNSTFRDANGNIVGSAQGSRTLDWQSEVGNASVPGSIASTPNDYPNPIVIQGSYLDNFTVNFLIRAVQANQNTTSLAAPRLTLFSGQRAVLVVQTQQAYVSDLTPVVAPGAALFDPQVSTTVATGVVLSVLATVSPDRKYVYLDMQPQLARLRALVPFSISALVQPVVVNGQTQGAATTVTGTLQLPTLDTTIVRTSCSVPDGATLMLGGQTLAGETEREQGVPILSKIPFLKRLFTNRAQSQDEQVLLILVKPTILIQHEQEQKQFPLLSSKVNG